MARPYSVIQPAPPRASRAKPQEKQTTKPEWTPEPGTEYRVLANEWPLRVISYAADELEAEGIVLDNPGSRIEIRKRYGYRAISESLDR